MSAEIVLRLVGGIFLLLANAFFVAVEFALTRLRQYDPSEIKGDSGLERAWAMTEKLEIYLTGCQVGITSTSILLGVVAEPAVTELIALLISIESVGTVSAHSISIVISVVLINFVHTVWGEQAPTYFGVERAKTVSKYCASPLYWWTQSIYPVLYVGDWLTKGTLGLFGITMERSWMQQSTEEGSQSNLKNKMVELLEQGNLSKDRRREVMNALEIDEVPVRDVMVPRDEIIFLSAQNSMAENMSCVQSGKSRYPLLDESEEDFLGVIYTTEMLANIEALSSGEMTLRELCRPGMTVPSEMPVSKLIDQFQQENQELALITGNDTILGLATLTDALEAIVGSAEDPMDVENGEGNPND